MSDYLTSLPLELIHKILDDVPTLDIFSSLRLVSKRLRSVALVYPRFRPDFSDISTSMNKKEFDYICTQLLYSIFQIVSLTLFDKDDPMTPAKNALFFSRFSSIDSTFSNLRSLTLTYINNDTWRLFKTRLPSSIVTLSIRLVYVDSYKCSILTSAILTELLFFSSSLKRLSVEMSNFSDDLIIICPQNPVVLSSVQYFHLEDITIDLSSLFAVAPMLHTLEVRFFNFNLAFGNIHPQPLYLQRLRIEFRSIPWIAMVTLLSSFPRLTDLTVIADDLDGDMADGFAWAQLLNEIEHFDFKLHFHWGAFKRQPFNLDSFRTKFWLEEKKWFITYNRQSKTDALILYTNPSSIDEYLSNQMVGIIVSEFPDIHCLTIKYQYIKYAFLYSYSHLTKFDLSQIATIVPMTFRDLVNYLNTSRIITCYSSSEWVRTLPNELNELLRNLSHLYALSVSVSALNYLFLHQWPDIIHLRIENDFETDLQLSSHDIDALCRSFTHIKRLDIHWAFVTDLAELLNKMNGTLTDIIIRQPQIVTNEQFITREWIERNTELQNFHYACDAMNTVSLWL